MGKQLVGGLRMWAAIVGAALVLPSDPDIRDLEAGRRAPWYLFAGGCSLLFFGVFFVGLKVFAVGLRQEWAGPAPGPAAAGRPGADSEPPGG
jgi:hypothetical protein